MCKTDLPYWFYRKRKAHSCHSYRGLSTVLEVHIFIRICSNMSLADNYYCYYLQISVLIQVGWWWSQNHYAKCIWLSNIWRQQTVNGHLCYPLNCVAVMNNVVGARSVQECGQTGSQQQSRLGNLFKVELAIGQDHLYPGRKKNCVLTVRCVDKPCVTVGLDPWGNVWREISTSQSKERCPFGMESCGISFGLSCTKIALANVITMLSSLTHRLYFYVTSISYDVLCCFICTKFPQFPVDIMVCALFQKH